MTTRIWQEMAKVGVVVLSMGLMTGTAQANNPTWDFAQSGTYFNGTVAGSGNFLLSETQTNSLASGVPTATATAWSNTGNAGTDYTKGTGGTTGLATNSLLQQGYIGAYTHIGVTDAGASGSLTKTAPPVLSATGGHPTNADITGGPTNSNELASPDHAIDNNGNVDSVLFTFTGGKVNLTSMQIGYEVTDADYTVLAYTGSGTPDLSTLTYGNTLSCSGSACKGLEQNGWTLVGNYLGTNIGLDVENDNLQTLSFANNYSSSYWLIGAYNPLVTLPTGYSNPSGLTKGNDYFKIFSVSSSGGGNTSSTPEPGTLFLMGAGLVGLVRTARRRQVFAA